MKLTREQQEILDGKQGPILQRAMSCMVKYGNAMDADELKISNYCPEVVDDDILSVLSAEQINLRIFKGFSDIKAALDKAILSDLLSDISFKQNTLDYKPPNYLIQSIILKTSQLLI